MKKQIWIAVAAMAMTTASNAESVTGMSCESKNTPHGFYVKWKESEGKILLNTMCYDLQGTSAASKALYEECLQCAKAQMEAYCKGSNDTKSRWCEAKANML